jgi:hypothetical protein
MSYVLVRTQVTTTNRDYITPIRDQPSSKQFKWGRDQPSLSAFYYYIILSVRLLYQVSGVIIITAIEYGSGAKRRFIIVHHVL